MNYSVVFIFVVCFSCISTRSVAKSNVTANILDCPIYKGVQLERNIWTPVPIGECMKCKCINEPNEPPSLGCLTCPEFELNIVHGRECHKSEVDNSLQYPDCCPKVVCSQTDNSL